MAQDPDMIPIGDREVKRAMKDAIFLMMAFTAGNENEDLTEFVRLLKESALAYRSYPASLSLILAFVVLTDTQSPDETEPGDDLYRYARLIHVLESIPDEHS